MSLFSKNMAISETKGVESYPYQVKEGQRHRYINLNAGRLFVQQPPKKGKGSFKLLCYRLQQGETTITPQDKTKSNTTKTSMHP